MAALGELKNFLKAAKEAKLNVGGKNSETRAIYSDVMKRVKSGELSSENAMTEMNRMVKDVAADINGAREISGGLYHPDTVRALNQEKTAIAKNKESVKFHHNNMQANKASREAAAQTNQNMAEIREFEEKKRQNKPLAQKAVQDYRNKHTINETNAGEALSSYSAGSGSEIDWGTPQKKGLWGKIKNKVGLGEQKTIQEGTLSSGYSTANYSNNVEAVASDVAGAVQDSGGSFDPYKSYLEKHGDSVSHVAHHNRIKQRADNFNAEYEVMKKNGAEESAYVALGRKYGFEIKPGGNVQEAANAHFMKKLEADPSLWDKAVGHNVPAKATALGLTGGAVLAMANSRGQKSNAELYGV